MAPWGYLGLMELHHLNRDHAMVLISIITLVGFTMTTLSSN